MLHRPVESAVLYTVYTRSGKVLRATMRKIADGKDYRVPPTIDDPAILDEVSSALQSIGYGKLP